MKKKFLLGAGLAVLAMLPLTARAYDATGAQQYLLAHSSSPWSAMALQVLNVQNISTDSLKNISSTSAIDYEAPILAITALGQDPKNFAGQDYVTKLESFHTGSQLGDTTTVNDDIFGILALLSAQVPTSDPVVSDSQAFVLAHQNSDGGWGFSTSATSDSNTTASAIVALRAAGLATSDAHIQSALTYLKSSQNTDGGFTYDPKSSFGTASDSSSTAWALWAITSSGQDLSSWISSGHTPIDYLTGNQTPAGFFSYQNGSGEDAFSAVTTAYAVIALAGKALPLGPAAALGSGGGLPATHAVMVTNGGNGTVTSSDNHIVCDGTGVNNCSYGYLDGTTITLSAKASSGANFSLWSGDCSGTSPTCQLTMNAEKHVTAIFTVASASAPTPANVGAPATNLTSPTAPITPPESVMAITNPVAPQVLAAETAPLPRTGSGTVELLLILASSFLLVAIPRKMLQ